MSTEATTYRCGKWFCRQELPPWNRPPYGDGTGLCAHHEYTVHYSRRRALGLIFREREVLEDGRNHRLLYLAKAAILVALFPSREILPAWKYGEVIVATCDFSEYPYDHGGSWHEVVIGWGWRPRTWRWQWRAESS